MSNLATGLSSHPICTAQLKDAGLIVNGHDPNKVLDLRTGTLKDLGLAAPGAAPTKTASAAGLVDGAVRYRVRWWDSSTFTMSLPSAELEVTLALEKPTITAPGSPPSRATHWILERTIADGSTFYPVNKTSAAPNGTAIATTTYQDNTADEDLQEADSLPANQGQPPPFPIVVENGFVLHGLGGVVHRPTCSCTSGSANVSSADGDFTQNMVGQDFSFDEDTDGVTYVIATVTNANNLVLATNYAGANKTSRPASIAGPRNIARWCENNEPECWGAAVVGGLQNEAYIGSGDALTAGVGLGTAGFLYAKATELWMHSYQLKPNSPQGGGDGRIFQVKGRRGALAWRCMKLIGGRVYGVDVHGVWRMDSPGAEPVPIDSEIQEDWRGLYFGDPLKWRLSWNPAERRMYVYYLEEGDTYPRHRFVYDLDGEKWIGRDPFPAAGWAADAELPDLGGNLRSAMYSEAVGSAGSYLFFDQIGPSLGAGPDATPLVGTVASGSNTTAQITSGSFPTSGEKLKGVPILLIRAADGTQERSVITNNTGDTLTFNALTGPDPTGGDTLVIGPIETAWRCGRFAGGTPEEFTRKKIFKRLYVLLETDADAVNVLVRAYYDGSTTPDTDRAALSEDGIVQTASAAPVAVQPSAGQLRYYVPLNHKKAFDAQFEVYSYQSGVAWKVLGLVVDYDIEGARDPRKV